MPIRGIYYQPPPPFTGGRQPHAQRKLAPQLLDTFPGAKGGQLWLSFPDKAVGIYTRFRRTLPTSVTSFTPSNPPFRHRMRQPQMQAIVLRAWQPPPPQPQRRMPRITPDGPPPPLPGTGKGKLIFLRRRRR
jgi:hypothetical protein